MKYINLFDTQAAYDAAEKYYPNTSYIEATDEVVYQEISPEPHSDIIVAKFTTTSANQKVKITNKQQYFSSIAVDGEPLTIGTGTLNHTFASAGEHEVEYKALDTTLIPDDAFNNCSKLTSVTIPNSVTTIDAGAFSSCYGLTSVTIPNSVTTIGNSAFYNCTGLTNITIPDSVTSIGINAFNHCYHLTSVTIPNSVTSIGGSAFSSCFGLTSIVVGSRNTKYDSRNNCNAIIETETNTLIAGCKNTIIPNSVTTIGGSAFVECTGLTSITIPDSVTTIGGSAFSNCTGLTSVTIGNSVTTIGQSAFYNCTGLTSVTIGNSVTTIGESAFMECTGLTSITSLATTPPTIQFNTFREVPEDCPIYVPVDSEFEYMDAEGWGDRAAYIQPIQ